MSENTSKMSASTHGWIQFAYVMGILLAIAVPVIMLDNAIEHAPEWVRLTVGALVYGSPVLGGLAYGTYQNIVSRRRAKSILSA